MITVDGTSVSVAFPWPTNDVGGGTVVREMARQANAAVRGAGHTLAVAMRFHDTRRTELGYEFIFTGTLAPPPEPIPEEVPA